MPQYSTLHVRMERQLEQRARRVARRFGLTLPDVVRLFLAQFVRKPHIEIGGNIHRANGRKNEEKKHT